MSNREPIFGVVMKKNLLSFPTYFLFIFCTSQIFAFKYDPAARRELENTYNRYCRESTDVYEHIPVFRDLSKQCSSVVELGLREMSSTWGFLQGLSENSGEVKSYLGIDMDQPPKETLNLAKTLSAKNGIDFQFVQADDMNVDIEPADLLFIDTLHTYCHLTYELEKFSPKIRKFIMMHDTSDPWGFIDDFQQYYGDYSEYPPEYDRSKKGLWAAVEDFLLRHPEWKLRERRTNCHGLTTLERVF
jgi:hypothetical protein